MPRTNKLLVLLAAAVGLAVALPLLAVANHAYVSDADDTRGRLDVRRARVNDGRPPTWTVVTYPRWSVERIWDAGYFMVRLDTFGKRRFDYYALVRSDGYGMQGSLWRDRANKPDRQISTLKAWHPKPRVLKLRIPLNKMYFGEQRVQYRWRVETLYLTPRCPRTCLDNAPDRGAVTEMVPWATPSPVPSGTPTETPSETPSESP